MKVLKTLLFVFFVIALSPHQALAQSTRLIEELSDLNRFDPLQNPAYTSSEDLIKRKIIDSKNKVVGEVEDITLRENGTLDAIAADFDRLNLNDTAYLYYRKIRIRPQSDTYALAIDANELEEFYPQLLANMDTAAGDEYEVYSVKKLKGIDVRSSDGKKVGEVSDVLFSGNGAMASALYVEISRGPTRGEHLAIPFRSAAIKEKTGRLYAQIENDMADAVFEMADD